MTILKLLTDAYTINHTDYSSLDFGWIENPKLLVQHLIKNTITIFSRLEQISIMPKSLTQQLIKNCIYKKNNWCKIAASSFSDHGRVKKVELPKPITH